MKTELQRIPEKTNKGKVDAKAKGVAFERKRTIYRDKVLAIRAQGGNGYGREPV